MSLYPVTSHALLSSAAKRRSSAALEAHTLAAETVLGFLGTAYIGDKLARATVAVVRQVNLQVAEPVNPGIQSETRGERSVTYVTRNGITMMVDSIALAIAEALAEEAIAEGEAAAPVFGPITSLR